MQNIRIPEHHPSSKLVRSFGEAVKIIGEIVKFVGEAVKSIGEMHLTFV